MLVTLATGLLSAERPSGTLDSFALPYPPELQRALDRTALRMVELGRTPPSGIAELIRWCRAHPLCDWPFELPDDAVGLHDHLLDPVSGRPTQQCHEWALLTRDSAVTLHDRRVVHSALDRCREAGDENAYSEFRRLLVDQPVLTSADAFRIAGDLALEPVRALIEEIYQPAGPEYRTREHGGRGRYATCDRCLILLLPLDGGEWWCERDWCRDQGAPTVGRELDPAKDGQVVQLARPLRQFVTGPGRAESALKDRLLALGLRVRMWPGYDAYDLHLTFPDGRVWALDVKDWANPALLGAKARPVPGTPPYDEAFWVVPRYRVDRRPGYQEVFRHHRPEAAGALGLLTDDQVVDRAEQRLGRVSRTATGGRDA